MGTSTQCRPIDADLAQELAIEHPRPFVYRRHVVAEDIGDVIGHVSNVRYVTWLDEAAEAHAAAVGCSRQMLLAESRMWFVGRHEIDYLAETWLHDEIDVYTWVEGFSRAQSWRAFSMFRPADRKVVARARTRWVFVNLETRRPTRVPPELALRFDPLPNPVTSSE